jgi:hypothetical protein
MDYVASVRPNQPILFRTSSYAMADDGCGGDVVGSLS